MFFIIFKREENSESVNVNITASIISKIQKKKLSIISLKVWYSEKQK